MEEFKFWCVFIFVIYTINLGVMCKGEDENGVASMKRTEQEALYSAIQGFVGKWWNGSDLYPDPCGWTPIQGVGCDLFDGFWYVTDLSIGPVHDNSLSCAQNVEFRPQLFELRHLKSLSFFNCFVSPHHYPVAIPTENWQGFAGSLESLEFRSNPCLIGQIPYTFGYLRNLRSLVLVENGLTGELPAFFGNLINLRRLNLAGNSFSGSLPDNFGELNQLLILDMSRNLFSGLLPSTFGGLTSLLKLDLSNNQLEGKIPQEIGKLKNLTLLDLSNNKFSGGLTTLFQEMSSLEQLVLSNNPTGGNLTNLAWHNLICLTVLDLSNTSLTGGIPDSISKLKRLRFLGLNDNMLTGKISTKIETLPNISAMHIYGNNLTGELKFSEGFYGKLGRRFGAWDNPNLCYPSGLISRINVPFGVKKCQQEVTRETGLDTSSRLNNNRIWNPESNPTVSLGFSIFRIDRFRYIFVFIVFFGHLLFDIGFA
ncbi:piriformospora indica-insensitive protein 2-like [Olea europaea var. sylvestris]|uniref:Piriformospora indica-insensitive 2-like n=1 Tax=Olea europaea subsp. europaea TaxID=158383 RepID=A0A8S0QH96_OLEEU|nr:piriformospora indica-insensitive protein 2-like [Olea europaea var. sylvestris]CAA2967139.1 piriformospora indica-insensitive 2-like [Olea europaea subsp. europaea]